MKTLKFDPRTKLIATLSISLLAISLDHPITLAILATLSFCALLLSKPQLKQLKMILLFIVLTCWGVIISQGIFYQAFPRTILLTIIPPFRIGTIHLGGLYIYVQGLFYGLVQSLRFAACLLSGVALCISTSVDDLFLGLVSLKIPYAISFLAIVAVRFLPIFAEEMENVRASMKLKGYKPFKKGILMTIKSELYTIVPVLTGAIRRSREVADALLSRGFNPLANRTQYKTLSWSLWEKGIISLFFLCAITIATVKILFWLYVNQILYFSTLRPLYGIVRFYM